MGKETGIQWTDHTFNPWWGCTKVSPGCDHCYADTLSTRWGYDIWGPDAKRRFFDDKHWAEPLRWNAAAEQAGVRRRVFCGSMCDWAEGRPDQAAARLRLFDLIEQTPYLDWQLLTKRPGAIPHLVPRHWLDTPPANVWYGTSVENQEQADRRIPQLLAVPAVVRFLSCEPLLGPVDLAGWIGEMYCCSCGYRGFDVGDDVDENGDPDCPQCGAGEWHFTNVAWHGALDQEKRKPIHWIITGGESGPGARPCHPDWARSLRDQCEAAGVAFHFKQWGEWVAKALHEPTPVAQGGNWGCLSRDGTWTPQATTWNGRQGDPRDDYEYTMVRIGKKAAGRLLDGHTWDEFPEAVPA